MLHRCGGSCGHAAALGPCLEQQAIGREGEGQKNSQENGGKEDGIGMGLAGFVSAAQTAIFLSLIFLSVVSVELPRHPWEGTVGNRPKIPGVFP